MVNKIRAQNMRKAVAMRLLLGAMSLAVFFPSYGYRSMLWLVDLGVITAIAMDLMTRITKERQVYLKPSQRPRPLNLATARRTHLIVLIIISAIALFMLLIAFGVINLPFPSGPSYYFVGFLPTSMLCLLLPLKSLEQSVAEHNEWLRRMSPPPDSVDGE